MFSNSNYSFYAKRQKLNETNALLMLSNNRATKNDFLLEIKGNSECNLNKDLNIPSWIKYDLTKIDKTIDLSGGGLWSIGINACVIS